MDIMDLHTHTLFSDGDATVEEILEVADGKGYKIGISDHVFCSEMTTMSVIENYLEKLAEHNVYKGVEANIGDYIKWTDKLLGKLDYVISSVHTFNHDASKERVWLSKYFGYRAGHCSRYDQQYKSSDSQYILENILKTIEKTFRSTRVDILGHSTVLPFYVTLKGTDYIKQWEDAVLSLCEKYNVAIEISGLWKEPGIDFIRRALTKDILFSLGSDCHRKDEICNLEYPLFIIEQLKIPKEKMFIINTL